MTDRLQKVRELIGRESKALDSLSNHLGSEVEELISLILSIEGRVILTGMGKSGHIGQKISATLSSTGTPALFIHPSESLHGDLGMVTPKDLVIFLSKSGENPELNLMMPTLRQMGIKTVALTSKPESSLAKHCHLIIDLGSIDEICPLALAPTTSATLMLVFLDCLAMILMEEKSFEPKDYALFHPGGQLGKRLLFKIEDVMVPLDQCPQSATDASTRELLHVITQGRMGCVIILDEHTKLLGLITDNDIRRSLEEHEAFFELPLKSILNPSPSTCSPSENAYEVLLRMRQRTSPISLMPVVSEDGVCHGLLRLEDLVQQGLV